MSDNNTNVSLIGIAATFVGIYVLWAHPKFWEWTNTLDVWSIPAKIVVALLYVEGILAISVLAIVFLFAIFKVAIWLVNKVTP